MVAEDFHVPNDLSQPTHRGHTHDGAGQGRAPWNPDNGNTKENHMRRDVWIKIRVSKMEKELFEAKARDAGLTIADLIRNRLFDYRLRKSAHERERIRMLARIGNNINQIARWVNTYKGGIDTIHVVSRLDALLRELKREP